MINNGLTIRDMITFGTPYHVINDIVMMRCYHEVTAARVTTHHLLTLRNSLSSAPLNTFTRELLAAYEKIFHTSISK